MVYKLSVCFYYFEFLSSLSLGGLFVYNLQVQALPHIPLVVQEDLIMLTLLLNFHPEWLHLLLVVEQLRVEKSLTN